MAETVAGPRVAIAGGGLIGLSIAWRLAQAGFCVTVFEKNILGAEASWAGAGMLAPGGEFEAPSALTALALASRRLYPEFVRELEQASGRTIDYQECGALDLAYDAEEWQGLQVRVQRQAELGVVGRSIALERVPIMWPRVRTEGLHGALFYPGDAIVDPRDLVAALVLACRHAGVALREQSPVEAVAVESTGTRVLSNGAYELFAAAVIAAGAWSSLIPIANVPALPASMPVKGHLVGFAQPDQTCNTIVRRGHTYLLQRASGLLIAGASVEHVGWDRSIDAAIAGKLVQEAAFVLPHLAETTHSEVWTGFRPGGAELRLGAWASERLYLAYGHYRNGILLTPATAREITSEFTANWETLRSGFSSLRRSGAPH